MLAFFLAPFYILVNVYVFRWLILWMGSCHYLFQSMGVRVILAVLYILVSSSLLTGFLVKKPDFLHRGLKVISNYFLGAFLYTFMVILAADLVRLILKYRFHAAWISSPYAFPAAGLICFLVILGIILSGFFHAKHIKVTRYEVTIDKAFENMDDLRIVLLADTHFGYNAGTLQAEKIVEKINEQEADIVCIAGDIFDNEYEAIRQPEKLAAILSSMSAKYGVYACWGNHDLNEPILAGFTFKHENIEEIWDPRMKALLKNSNIRLLEDETVLIHDSFYLVGRKDASLMEKAGEKRETPARLTEELDKSKPVIFLDHQPKELQEIADAGADLDLCGHTHDGQTFPGNLTVKLMWKNPCGLLKKGKMTNIVTSGAGVWGPAMRVGTNSEICVIDVHA